MAKLDNKIAVITSSDSGMGQAMAEEFASEGADIAVTFHTDSAGAEQTRQRVDADGRRGAIYQVDVVDESSVATLFARIERELGTPEILVNAAGVNAKGAPVVETTAEEFDRVIKTDLYGAFFCCREFIRKHQAVGGGGKIINISLGV
jgi:glucose 1-dehydrogenase